MKILVLNAGSSSLKSHLYELPNHQVASEGTPEPTEPAAPLWTVSIDWQAESGVGVLVVTANGVTEHLELQVTQLAPALHHVLNTLTTGKTQVLRSLAEIEGVGHRVVHGGSAYQWPTRITTAVKATIAELVAFAPAHNPAHLAGIEAIETILGDVPQVAVFDTAFHHQMPLAAAVYPIPYEWFEQGIRRYGFHGISHEYCAQRAAKLLQRPLTELKLITCHLGNGCSLAAIKAGVSLSTTMGFTPLEGLMMGSRSGSIDPAILIYWMRTHGFDADQLEHLLNQESGLKGISGISGDFRQIGAAMQAGNARAQLAFDIYVQRLAEAIGAALPLLGGLDALIFTAGVGENSPLLRAAVCDRFSFLSLQLDAQKNQANPVDMDIATPHSAVRILVIHTQENWAIAQSTWQLLIAEGLADDS